MGRVPRLMAGAVLMMFVAPAAAQTSMAITYRLHCSGCHGESGKGVPEAGIPDLNDAGFYLVIPEGRAYLISVPGLSQSSLTDKMAARILNYVLHRFSESHLPQPFSPYTEREVAKHRGDKASDAKTRRDQILRILSTKGFPLPAAY